mmetsp:Transcript_7003/g.42961  ORF Transcript_7003/g.42961 Transcript_7003/m.42961 type:complete len:190 (-) Transcript_7003:2941-3510(-)
MGRSQFLRTMQVNNLVPCNAEPPPPNGLRGSNLLRVAPLALRTQLLGASSLLSTLRSVKLWTYNPEWILHLRLLHIRTFLYRWCKTCIDWPCSLSLSACSEMLINESIGTVDLVKKFFVVLGLMSAKGKHCSRPLTLFNSKYCTFTRSRHVGKFEFFMRKAYENHMGLLCSQWIEKVNLYRRPELSRRS